MLLRTTSIVWKIIFSAVLIKLCSCQVNPDEYIIDVSAKCPENIADGPAVISVTTDLPSSKPFVLCKNGEFPFLIHKMGNWSLNIYFDLNHTRECIFHQKSESADIYSVSVYVPLSDNVITINIPEKIVNCIYDPVGDEMSDIQTLGESNKPVKQITQHRAEPSTSRIDICIADAAGNCMTESVRIGKNIMIKAMLRSNSSEEQGFQTLTCSAVGPGYKLPLLLGGCGDGNVIPKHLGFTTTGRVAESPIFKAFRVPGGNTLTYDCSFVVCPQACDGSSCNVTSSTRKKRDTLAVRETSIKDTIRIPKSDVMERSNVSPNTGLGKVKLVRNGLDDSLNDDLNSPIKDKNSNLSPELGKEKQDKSRIGAEENESEPPKAAIPPASRKTDEENTPKETILIVSGKKSQDAGSANLNHKEQIQISELKREVEQTRALWTMESLLVLLLAIFSVVFMAVTVKILLSLMKSVKDLQNKLEDKPKWTQVA